MNKALSLTMAAALFSGVAGAHMPQSYWNAPHQGQMMPHPQMQLPQHMGKYFQHPMPPQGTGMQSEKPLRLGISMLPVAQAELDSMGIEFGVRIADVQTGSRASDAALKAGDVVTRIGDRPAYSPKRLQHLVAKAEDQTTITVLREGEELKINLDLSDKQVNKAVGGKAFLGVQLQQMTPALKEAFGASNDNGVLVADVVGDSAAQQVGIQAGDVITAIAGETVGSVAEVHAKVKNHLAGESVEIQVLRDRQTLTKQVQLGSQPEAVGKAYQHKPYSHHKRSEKGHCQTKPNSGGARSS